MKKYKICLFLLLLILFINPVLSLEEEGIRFIGKKDTSFKITDDCTINGLVCGNDFNCTITVEDPEQEIIISNEQMTKDENIYFYQLNYSQTFLSGKYKDTVFCFNSTIGDKLIFYHEVTPLGRDFKISQSIIYIIVIIISILILFLTFMSALKLPSKNISDDKGIFKISYLKYLKFPLFLTCYLELIWIINILVGLTNNFLFLGISFNFFRIILNILLIGLMPIIPLAFLIFFTNLYNDIKFKEILDRTW